MKKTNHVRSKYKLLLNNIQKSKDPNQLVINFSIFGYKYNFNYKSYIYKPDLINQICILEIYIIKVAKQYFLIRN